MYETGDKCPKCDIGLLENKGHIDGTYDDIVCANCGFSTVMLRDDRESKRLLDESYSYLNEV